MRKAISIVIVKRSHYTLASTLLVAAVACGEGSVDPEDPPAHHIRNDVDPGGLRNH